MLQNLLTEQVQLGFDIATSVTIIGALASWSVESRRRASKERQLGLNERARVASLEKVQTILSEFETSFSDLVQSSAQFEGPIRRRIDANSDEPFKRLERFLQARPEQIDTFVTTLEQIRHHVDVYYESIQKRRYSLVPVLDSLPGGNQFLGRLQQDIKEIGDAHDSINSGNVALLKEFHAIATYAQEQLAAAEQQHTLAQAQQQTDEQSSQEELSHSAKVDWLMKSPEFYRKAYALLSDEDYEKWVLSFVPSEQEAEFCQRRDANTLLDDTSLLIRVTINLAGTIIRNPNRLYSQILWLATKQVRETQVECKDILIKLSALTHKLMVNNEEIDMEGVIKLYESDQYFGRSSSRR